MERDAPSKYSMKKKGIPRSTKRARRVEELSSDFKKEDSYYLIVGSVCVCVCLWGCRSSGMCLSNSRKKAEPGTRMRRHHGRAFLSFRAFSLPSSSLTSVGSDYSGLLPAQRKVLVETLTDESRKRRKDMATKKVKNEEKYWMIRPGR